MVKDKNFYKTLLLIGLPVAFQSLISLSVVFLDNIMVGNIRENTKIVFAGVTQANAITTLFAFFIKGLSGGASVMISQYWGKKDLEKIKTVFSIIFSIGLSLAAVITTLIFLFPKGAMSIVTSDEMVKTAGAQYIQIVCFSYVFYILTETFVTMMRCVEIVRVSLYVSIVSFFVNLAGNYLLIFGNESLHIPAMGIKGAAIATVIARVVEFMIVMTFTFKIQKRIAIKIKDLFRYEKIMWFDYIKYGLPIMAGDTQWGFVGFFKAIIIGRLDSRMMSANGIAEVIMSLAGIFTVGLGSAACVIIGKTVGAKEYEKTRKYSNTLQILFASFGVFMCTVLFFSRTPLVSLYGIISQKDIGGFDDATINLAKTFIAIGAFTLIGTFYHATCFTGINRGSGDGKFVFKVDMICGWGVVLPLTFLSAVVFGFPLPIVFLSARIDQCFKWIIAFFRLRGDKWIRNVTR
ncbi:MAG: MATE family efflux transporter [Oscillospiraceae bacterium]|nr:MATE family efflux transporter [Oscillospiraceae bacterium]